MAEASGHPVSSASGVRKCGICDGDPERRDRINLLLSTGMNMTAIETQMRSSGMPAKRETITKHFTICLASIRPDPNGVVTSLVNREHLKGDDFAVMIRGEAVRMLREGSLRVRTSDGLWAQALIDKRVEKAADRDLMLKMASLLSGRPAPPEVIVGEYRDLDEPAPTRRLPG